MMSYVCLVLVLARCTRLRIRSPGNLNRKTVSYFLEEGGSHKIWNCNRLAARWMFRETRKSTKLLKGQATVQYQIEKKRAEGRKRQRIKE